MTPVLVNGDASREVYEALLCIMADKAMIAKMDGPVECVEYGKHNKCANQLEPGKGVPQICWWQENRFIFKAYDWRLMVVVQDFTYQDLTKKKKKPTEQEKRFCQLLPPGTALLQIHIYPEDVLAYYKAAHGSFIMRASYDEDEIEVNMRTFIETAIIIANQDESLPRSVGIEVDTWGNKSYPMGPFQFNVRRGPGVSTSQREDLHVIMEDFNRYSEGMRLGYTQSIVFAVIALFGFCVAIFAIDLNEVAEVEEGELMYGAVVPYPSAAAQDQAMPKPEKKPAEQPKQQPMSSTKEKVQTPLKSEQSTQPAALATTQTPSSAVSAALQFLTEHKSIGSTLMKEESKTQSDD